MGHGRRGLTVVGVVLGALIALGIVGHTIAVRMSGGALAREVQRLRDAGEPLTVAEMMPEPVPSDENAATLYQQAFSQGAVSAEERKRLDAFVSSTRPLAKTASSDKAEANAILDRYTEAIALTEEASRRPKCAFPVRWDLPSGKTWQHLNRMKALSQLLSGKAVLLASEGKPGEALAVCRAMLRMGDHLAPEPALVSQSARFDIQRRAAATVQRIMAVSSPSATDCEAMFEAIADVDNSEALVFALKAQRAEMLWALELVRAGHAMSPPKSVKGFMDNLPTRLYFSYLGRPVRDADWARLLRQISREIERAKEPYRTVTKTPGEFRLSGHSSPPRYWDPFWFPVSSTGFGAEGSQAHLDQTDARLGLAQLALAAEAYRAKQGGYPDSLAELRRVIDWPLPDDPFSGKPFVYRREKHGFVAYSLGANLADDGGSREQRVQATALGPYAYRFEGDIVWRQAR